MNIKKLALLTTVTAAALALSACGGAKDTPAAAPTAAPTSAAASAPTGAQTLKAASVPGFTKLVTNATGRTVYRFDKDTNKPAKSNCADACLVKWPAVLAGPDGAVQLDGIDKSLVGTLDRPEGKQLTLNGWPLYYYQDDLTLGQTTGHGVGGIWFAITPDGGKATKTAASPTPNTGYNY